MRFRGDAGPEGREEAASRRPGPPEKKTIRTPSLEALRERSLRGKATTSTAAAASERLRKRIVIIAITNTIPTVAATATAVTLSTPPVMRKPITQEEGRKGKGKEESKVVAAPKQPRNAKLTLCFSIHVASLARPRARKLLSNSL